MTAYVTASAGNWSTPGNWTPSGPPANGDTVTLNHAMTVDTNTTVGASGANATTAAILWGTANLKLTINANITLISRGDIKPLMSGTAVQDVLQLNAGAILEFDSSAASAPATTKYAFLQTGNNQWWRIVCSGTLANPCQIRSNAGGGFGYVDNSFVGGPYFHCTFTKILRLGDASKQMMEIYTNGGSLPEIYFQQCIFDTCGRLFQRSSAAAGVQVTYDRDVWLNSANADDNLRLGELSGAGSVGTITGCYLDCSFSPYIGMAGWSLTNNIYRRGAVAGSNSTSKATLSSNNLVCFISNNWPQTFADHVDEYWLSESTTDNNVHAVAPSTSFSTNFTGLIFEGSYTGVGQTEADLIILPGADPASVITHNAKNCLILPQPDGIRGLGTLVSLLGRTSTNWKFVIEHNTAWDVRNIGGGNFSFVNYGESGGGVAGMIQSLKSNLGASDSATAVAYIGRLGGSVVQDVLAAANCTYNAGNNLYTGSGGFAGFDDGSGGGSIFSSGTPNLGGINLGTLSTTQIFTDPSRRFRTWGIAMGVPPNNQAVIDLMRQRIDWSDPLYNPSNGASPLALITWVRAGWTVRVASLNNAGHDGVTVGALPFQDPGPVTYSLPSVDYF